MGGVFRRPLLCVERNEIEQYLLYKGQEFCTDNTNLIDEYSRNKIRLNVLPYITQNINERAVEHIIKNANMLTEINNYIEKNASKVYEDIVKIDKKAFTIKIEDILTQDIVIRKIIIRKAIEKLSGKLKDIEEFHIEYVLSLITKNVGKKINLPYNIIAKRGYDNITLYIKHEIDEIKEKLLKEDIIITPPCTVQLDDIGIKIKFSVENYKKNIIIEKNGYTKLFNYDKIKNTVLLRTRQEGDFIQFDNKGRKKKIKALFIDEKIPREDRDKKWLLADNSHIMWIVGGRISEAYKIDDNTKKILIAKIYKGEGEN